MINKIYKYAHCPLCGCQWQDGDLTKRLITEGVCETVEEAHRLIESHFGYNRYDGNTLAFTRLTHISIRLHDGTLMAHYMCPDCGQHFFENGVPIYPDRN